VYSFIHSLRRYLQSRTVRACQYQLDLVIVTVDLIFQNTYVTHWVSGRYYVGTTFLLSFVAKDEVVLIRVWI